MSVPLTTVEFGFGLGPYANLDGTFVLDDPDAGVLDDADYTLADDEVWTDATSLEVVRAVQVRRGKSNELERYDAGRGTVLLGNLDGAFNPLNTSSPLYPNVKPRRSVRISCNGYPIMRGQVEDWDLNYELSGDATASAKCVDGFAILAGQELDGFTATLQASGDRVAAILDRAEVAWPAATRDIDAGSATLQADVVASGTNVLTYLQLVEQSEPGDLFISSQGLLTFKGRATNPTLFTDVVLSDEGDGIGYNAITVSYGTEQLYNVVKVTRAGGAEQTATADATVYAISALTRDGVLLSTDAAALELAQWWAGIYSEPLVRVDSVKVQLAGLTTTEQNTLLGLELTDVLTVKHEGSESWSKVTSIDHDIRADSHEITFGFANEVGASNLVLDDAVFGVLDTARLGF